MSPEHSPFPPRPDNKRWTERANTVLQLAQQSATQDGSESISLNHLVLGLLQEGEGLGSKVLSNLLTEENLTRFKESVLGQSNKTAVPNSTNQLVRELSAEVVSAVALATDEASKLNHHYLGTEHLLLGILRYESQPDSVPVLTQLGVTYEKAWEEARRILLYQTQNN